MRVVDSDHLLPSLDPHALIEALRAGHRDGVDAVGRVLLSEPTAPDATNHFLALPAWRFGVTAGAKLVAVFPGNESRGRGANIHSIYVLFDGEDGSPLCLITGESFTRYKTAADSALGAAFLARADARVLALIGAGAQAEAQVRLICAARPSIRQVIVWNRTSEKARALVAQLGSAHVDVSATEELEPAVRAADIVSCVTSSSTPVLHGRWLKPGTHVDLVGSFMPQMREADDETVRRARIFVDNPATTITQSGDLADPIARGVITPSDILADLFDLCAGRVAGRLTDSEITVFKNGGGGHLDLMVAHWLYRNLRPAP